jgi:hypothetical protein
MAYGFKIIGRKNNELFAATSNRTSLMLLDSFQIDTGVAGSKLYSTSNYGDVSNSIICIQRGERQPNSVNGLYSEIIPSNVYFSGNRLYWDVIAKEGSQDYREYGELSIWVFKR